jgi:hypothetical protein
VDAGEYRQSANIQSKRIHESAGRDLIVLTIIFGAGASYDSDPDRPVPYPWDDRPPLANQLFDRRPRSDVIAAKYRQIASIANDVRAKVKAGQQLEAVLAALQQSAPGYPVVPSQLMAIRFYLRDLIDDTSNEWSRECSGATTYADFVNRVNEWSYRSGKLVNYITFNYDHLLEEALLNMNLRFDNLDDYIRPPMVGTPNIIRPHGSVRWYELLDAGKPAQQRLPPGEVIRKAGELVPSNRISIGPGKNGIYVPALAIPVNNKQEYVCPETHINTMHEILRATKFLLIIGWRGTEQRFGEELRALLLPGTHLVVCNGAIDDCARTLGILKLHQTLAKDPTDLGFSALSSDSYLDEIFRVAEHSV